MRVRRTDRCGAAGKQEQEGEETPPRSSQRGESPRVAGLQRGAGWNAEQNLRYHIRSCDKQGNFSVTETAIRNTYQSLR